MNARKTILLIVLFTLCRAVVAQRDVSVSLKATFSDYAGKYISEKLFVHTDREFYLAGEIIWYKIYEVEGTHHTPLALSRVAYVELLDKNNQPVLQQKISLANGLGSASMFLPTTISAGTYVFRAYTSWMKNTAPDYFFHKTISIVNSLAKRTAPVLSTKVSAAFFPEGGNLIAGVVNKIAVKVNDDAGKGLDFKGVLINDHHDTVARFSPLKFGMGNFSFTPSPGVRYRALIRAGNVQQRVDLPVATSGYALRLTSTGDKINILVTHPAAPDNEPVCLFIHAQQQISKAEVMYLKNDTVSFWMNKRDLAEGISHVTVFTKELVPVAERLYFKKPTGQLSIITKLEKHFFNKREKVSVTVQSNQNANLSLAVYQLDSLGNTSTTHIGEYVWLTSDLKGVIESPDYYFSSDMSVAEAQDNLMLTQGWRRFAWKDVLEQREMIRFLPEYAGHLIQATIRDEKDQPVANTIAFASVIGKNANLTCAQSDERGDVFFEMKNLVGSQRIVLQTNLRKDSTKHIEIKNPFATTYSSDSLPEIILPTSYRQHLLNRSIAMQAQRLYTEREIEKFKLPASDSLTFYGAGNKRFLLDDYTRFPVMEEVLREYISGVLVRKRNDKFRFIMLNVNGTVFDESPMVLLDGVPVFDENEIMKFDPLRVKKIDVIPQKYFLGPAVFSGVMSFSTYKGDLAGFELNPKCVALNYDGLELQREFYSPDYAVKSDSRIPDFRSLLYWNGSIETIRNQLQRIEFFTSDLPGNFRIVIEGLSQKGTPGSVVGNFEVR